MADLTDVELLSRLQVALAPAPARPDEVSLARLHATLAELEAETEPVDIVSARRRRELRRGLPRRVTRSSVVAASALTFALTASVAAAAVATNTLPGPTRAFAYDLGLPVTSPALFRAQQSANQLREAIVAKNHQQETRLSHELVRDLKSLNASDLSQIRSTAEKLLGTVGLRVPKVPNAVATPITPTVTIPTVSVPRVSVPSVTVPKVTVPKVTTPSVSVPGATVPSVSVPTVTLPPVTIPSVTLPNIPLT
jgi:hypothetical protein